MRVTRLALKRAFGRVLALLLFLQWGAAFTQCEALHGAGQVGAPICSTVIKPGFGDHRGAVPPVGRAHLVCPVCQGLAHAALPPAPPMLIPVAFALVATPVHGPAAGVPTPRASPVQARAPPAIS
jgi:hypothetical protein